MDTKTIKKVLKNIESAFANEQKYELRKSVEEIHDGKGDFLGDFVNFLMVDKDANPPIFYFAGGPFDIVSKQDPQQALVWKGGKMLLNTDFTDYAAMRTGAMDSIALKLCGIDSLGTRKVLMFGVGRTGRWSLRILKEVFVDLAEIDYINSTNTSSKQFEAFAAEWGVKTSVGHRNALEDYDIILFHTNTTEPILKEEDINRIKSGAIITTFLGSEKPYGEVADAFYCEDSNIVLDWEKNLKRAKDILDSGTSEKDIIYLKDLLNHQSKLSDVKKYTIFRFVGTPMQNIGVLQALI